MPPNQALQRTGDQRPFVARWSGRRSVVVRPPPLSFGVRRIGMTLRRESEWRVSGCCLVIRSRSFRIASGTDVSSGRITNMRFAGRFRAAACREHLTTFAPLQIIALV
jgi:hypothetical protein